MVEEVPTNKAALDARFSELYRAHLRDVYSYSYYRVGNHHDAEDLTEQTFLQAYRHLERALRESEGRPLRPWLIRIAHNLAANFYRDRSRKPEAAIEDADLAARGDGELRGTLRVAASSSFTFHIVIPRLEGFLARHPKLRIVLLVSDQRQALITEGVDVAFRLHQLRHGQEQALLKEIAAR